MNARPTKRDPGKTDDVIRKLVQKLIAVRAGTAR
jgi:hypothetical protein